MLGIFWTFIQPLVTIGVVVTVFLFGLKGDMSHADGGYLPWLVGGLLPWFFISEATILAQGSIIERPYLVKKIHFSTELLPLIKVLSACATSLIFTVVGGAIVYFTKGSLGSPLFVIYFYFSASMFLFAFGLISSSINVLFRDFGNLISVGMQLLFWITPVFWSVKNVPMNFQRLLFLNPFFYLIETYRRWFSGSGLGEDYFMWSIYFWVFCLVTFAVGFIIFRKLKVHFADVI